MQGGQATGRSQPQGEQHVCRSEIQDLSHRHRGRDGRTRTVVQIAIALDDDQPVCHFGSAILASTRIALMGMERYTENAPNG
jgi:hypothetical protein